MMKSPRTIIAIIIAVVLVLATAGWAVAASRGGEKMLGVVVAERNAALDVADQPGVTDTLRVDRAFAPAESWIVVHLDDGGKPGMRIGLKHISAGDNAGETVELDTEVALTDKVIVAIHADRGVRDRFEFDMDRFETSPDKPYFIDGMELAKVVRVR
jgi:hypothetical protein